MKIIKSRQGDEISVSDCDYDLLVGIEWNVYDRYAESVINGRSVKMHRLILNAKESEHVDHIDGLTLNNQRENIRVCNRFQNQQNRKLNCNSATGAKGVKLLPNGKYRVRVQAFGVRYSLGCYDTIDQAKKVREIKSKELHNEFYREK